MQIFDFITQDELDNLPEDDRFAFAAFAQHAYRKLSNRLESLNGPDENVYALIQESKRGYMNVILAAARRYQISPLDKYEIPKAQNFSEDDYNQFKFDLDFYMTQILLDNSIRDRSNAISIDDNLKDKIRKYVLELRNCIDTSNLSQSEKQSLQDKLSVFEDALNKRRVSILAASMMVLAILGVPGSVWASVDIVSKLSTNVLQAVAQAKAVSDAARLAPPSEAPKALAPPRQETGSSKKESSAFGRQSSGSTLSDDIPF